MRTKGGIQATIFIGTVLFIARPSFAASQPLSLFFCGPGLESLADLLPFKRSSPKHPEYGFPSDLKGYPLRTILKARRINTSGNYVASLEEVGAGHAAGNAFQFAGQASNTIVDSGVTQAQESANIKHNNGVRIPGSSISLLKLGLSLDATHNSAQQKARAAKVAADRFKKATADHQNDPIKFPSPLPEDAYLPHIFTLANTVTTSWREDGGRGYIGLRFNTKAADGSLQVNEILVDVRMFDKDTEQQKIDIGIFSTNLAYATVAYRHDPEKFMRSLSDDLREKRTGDRKSFEIDMIQFHGEGIKHLAEHNNSLDLDLLDGATDYVMFRPQPPSSARTPGPVTHHLQPVGLDTLYGGHYLVVKDDLDPATPHPVDTPAFQSARLALAEQLHVPPNEVRVISLIAVENGHIDKTVIEQNLGELERAGSSVVIHRANRIGPSFVDAEMRPARAFGAKDVHVYQPDGTVTQVAY